MGYPILWAFRAECRKVRSYIEEHFIPDISIVDRTIL